MNKTLEILSYIIVISLLVALASGLYNLVMLHFTSYTLALCVALFCGCLYGIIWVLKEKKDA